MYVVVLAQVVYLSCHRIGVSSLELLYVRVRVTLTVMSYETKPNQHNTQHTTHNTQHTTHNTTSTQPPPLLCSLQSSPSYCRRLPSYCHRLPSYCHRLYTITSVCRPLQPTKALGATLTTHSLWLTQSLAICGRHTSSSLNTSSSLK